MMIKKILLKKLYNKPISAEVESRHSVKVSNLVEHRILEEKYIHYRSERKRYILSSNLYENNLNVKMMQAVEVEIICLS